MPRRSSSVKIMRLSTEKRSKEVLRKSESFQKEAVQKSDASDLTERAAISPKIQQD